MIAPGAVLRYKRTGNVVTVIRVNKYPEMTRAFVRITGKSGEQRCEIPIGELRRDIAEGRLEVVS